MIRTESISKRYGAHLALDNVSFEVEKGEICGFLGPNGAGKTSMMRILTGFMPPSAGRASIAGFDTRENPLEVKKRVGYLPESTPLYMDMRVAEYLNFAAEIKGMTARDQRRRNVGSVMEATRITDRQRSIIKTLSKGYRQRVGLAQALLGDPDVMILDEPTIGLDPRQIVEIRSLIQDLAGKRTVILSSHILSEIQAICTRALIINNGKLVASGAMTELSGAGKSRLSARIARPEPGAQAVMAGLPGVERVEKREGSSAETVFELILAPGGDSARAARMGLVRAAAEKGWDLMEMAPAVMSLEETYIRLISSDNAAADGAAAQEPAAGEGQ